MSDQLLAALTAQAQQEQPRLFAICGVYEGLPALENDERTYVEWGLEFPGQSVAIAYSAGSMTRSSSAISILDGNMMMGPARIVWFD